MGTADRIERERQQKRARILEAARELFVERGFEAVTLREIAQRIEYSTTAIYVQFADKAALIEAMLTEDFAAFSKGLEAAASIPDPVERLVQLHHAYVEFALGMPHHYQLLFLTPASTHEKPPHESPMQIGGYRVLLATVTECIETGRFRPEHTDVNAVTQTIWGCVHGMVSLQIVLGAHKQFRWRERSVLDRTMLDVMLVGVLRDGDKGLPKRKPKRR